LDLFLNNTNATWPLIRFLLDDPLYRATYRQHVEDLLARVVEPNRLVARLRTEQALIAPYIVGAEGELPGHTFLSTPAQFDASVNALVAYVQARHATVHQALGTTP
ncbi:MAG: CotH kinase family protein, partial [Vicinamibacterales bacterium]